MAMIGVAEKDKDLEVWQGLRGDLFAVQLPIC
jgi:hypothetical protein